MSNAPFVFEPKNAYSLEELVECGYGRLFGPGKGVLPVDNMLMLDRITTDTTNKIKGISISPKKTHNIIKVWNSDSKTFSSPADLLKLIPDLKMEEIIYTPFTDKKM